MKIIVLSICLLFARISKAIGSEQRQFQRFPPTLNKVQYEHYVRYLLVSHEHQVRPARIVSLKVITLIQEQRFRGYQLWPLYIGSNQNKPNSTFGSIAPNTPSLREGVLVELQETGSNELVAAP